MTAKYVVSRDRNSSGFFNKPTEVVKITCVADTKEELLSIIEEALDTELRHEGVFVQWGYYMPENEFQVELELEDVFKLKMSEYSRTEDCFEEFELSKKLVKQTLLEEIVESLED